MDSKKSAVALGLFDGVHFGHLAVLKLATESGLVPSVFTFNAETVCLKKSTAGYIFNDAEKAELLKKEGIENICSVSFDEVCNLSGEEFVKNILVDKMNAGFVSCGDDFRFGKNASCGVKELCGFGKKYGFEVKTAEDVYISGERVSSAYIRKWLINGDVDMAALWLGKKYTISKKVVHGAELGRTIGFPTINQVFDSGQLVPKYGVYASRVIIDGKHYVAMTNIGIKPTVNYGGLPLAETHIIDFSGNLYGKNINVELIRFMRPEQKFDSVDELKMQIATDMENIKNSLKIRDNIMILSLY